MRGATSLVLLLALACGVDEPVPTPRHPVTFIAESDPDVPLEGVRVIANGEELGVSDELGLVHAALQGTPGTMMQIAYECPEGHEEPERPKSLVLHSFQSLDPEAGARGLEMKLECPPLQRWAALVIRAGQPDLPILVGDEEVARTDASGVAHYVLRGEPGSRHRVTISTEADERLQPQNPRALITLGDQADTFVIEEEITERSPPRRRRRARRRRRPPTRMTIMRITRID